MGIVFPRKNNPSSPWHNPTTIKRRNSHGFDYLPVHHSDRPGARRDLLPGGAGTFFELFYAERVRPVHGQLLYLRLCYITALLQTKLGVESILAGIIVNTGLYTINIFIMGKSILNLNKTTTVFTMVKDWLAGTPLENWSRFIVAVVFVGIVASSINPNLTIIVGLCVANAMTALGGCLLGEYQKSCDINMGTGMVTIALASLIIGETLLGRGSIPVRIVGVIFGSCLYRVIVAIAMRFNLPASALKLVSALIVAIAIASPTLRQLVGFQKLKWKRKAQYGGKTEKAAAGTEKEEK